MAKQSKGRKKKVKVPVVNLQDSKASSLVSGMYQDYFLDYASYVILERAVPTIEDGLKPVQRRIFHSMNEMDDGRFNKVANIIGHTMQYHPHGDAAIGSAIVHLGQKDLMIETQGNWGDLRTGDSAAAPRYIEARLSKFANAVAFNNDTTDWALSYDGRKKEPVQLSMKFPLLLAQGVEGIAVGLATKILPHNFIELCRGSIDVLKGKRTKILPDFPTGGFMDASEYNRGQKGGRVKLRAKIDQKDKKTLAIHEIPFSTTTNSLIDSIVKANDKGKIKIKKVVDNTAAEVEILIELAPGISPDVTIDALYAFTDCEVSISPNACVIIEQRPHFMSVDDILKQSTMNTKALLKQELEILKNTLEEKWHFSSLEKIFIEKRIYRDIEECETWEAVIAAIDKGLKPYKKLFKRTITEEDIVRLTEIKIKRISKFDSFKADEQIKKIEEDLKETKKNLKNLNDFAIVYFENLLKKFGEGKERKTQFKDFETIKVRQVAIANRKLYVDAKDGFIGHSLRGAEQVAECSDIDNIIVFRKDGKFIVTKIGDKKFVGKGIIHAAVWKKGDDRTVYNMIYANPEKGKNMAKRFAVTGVTRDKEYDLSKGAEKAKVVYFSANPNGESEVVGVSLSPNCKAKKKQFDFDFGEIAIKGRASGGNILTKWPIRKVVRKELGESSLGGREIWLDESVGRLNTNERGRFLGEFQTDERIIVVFKSGEYEMTDFDLNNRYDMEKIEMMEKYEAGDVVTAVHFEPTKEVIMVKRFEIETSTLGQRFKFISEERGARLELVTLDEDPCVDFFGGKKLGRVQQDVAEIIEVKGWKAMGNILTKVKQGNRALLWAIEEDGDEEVDDGDEGPGFDVGEQIEWDLD